jgi:hypothetical protein
MIALKIRRKEPAPPHPAEAPALAGGRIARLGLAGADSCGAAPTGGTGGRLSATGAAGDACGATGAAIGAVGCAARVSALRISSSPRLRIEAITASSIEVAMKHTARITVAWVRMLPAARPDRKFPPPEAPPPVARPPPSDFCNRTRPTSARVSSKWITRTTVSI